MGSGAGDPDGACLTAETVTAAAVDAAFAGTKGTVGHEFFDIQTDQSLISDK